MNINFETALIAITFGINKINFCEVEYLQSRATC